MAVRDLVQSVQDAGGPLRIKTDGKHFVVTVDDMRTADRDSPWAASDRLIQTHWIQDMLAGVLRRDLVARGHAVEHAQEGVAHGVSVYPAGSVPEDGQDFVAGLGNGVLTAFLRAWLAVAENGGA